MQTKADVRIRWLIKADMNEVLEIEQHSFEFPWTEEDFLCVLRQSNAIGMVAESGGEIVGFMVFELHKDHLHILSFAVHQAYRRQGVGRAMVQRLKDKLSQQRRKRIFTEVRETSLGALKFFRRLGFVATLPILKGFYEETEEDAYQMRYTLNAAEDIYSPYSPKNRISEYGQD